MLRRPAYARASGRRGLRRAPCGVRIVRLANFVTARSGGLRTALTALGAEYVAAGHEPVLVVPGAGAGGVATAQGRMITVPGPVAPGTGGYRVLLARRRVARL